MFLVYLCAFLLFSPACWCSISNRAPFYLFQKQHRERKQCAQVYSGIESTLTCETFVCNNYCYDSLQKRAIGEMITQMKRKICLTHPKREDFMEIMALILVSCLVLIL